MRPITTEWTGPPPPSILIIIGMTSAAVGSQQEEGEEESASELRRELEALRLHIQRLQAGPSEVSPLDGSLCLHTICRSLFV